MPTSATGSGRVGSGRWSGLAKLRVQRGYRGTERSTRPVTYKNKRVCFQDCESRDRVVCSQSQQGFVTYESRVHIDPAMSRSGISARRTINNGLDFNFRVVGYNRGGVTFVVCTETTRPDPSRPDQTRPGRANGHPLLGVRERVRLVLLTHVCGC